MDKNKELTVFVFTSDNINNPIFKLLPFITRNNKKAKAVFKGLEINSDINADVFMPTSFDEDDNYCDYSDNYFIVLRLVTERGKRCLNLGYKIAKKYNLNYDWHILDNKFNTVVESISLKNVIKEKHPGIDLTNCLTIGDVMERINAQNMQMEALF